MMNYSSIKLALLASIITITSCSFFPSSEHKKLAEGHLQTDGFYEKEDGTKLFFYRVTAGMKYVFIEDGNKDFYPAANYQFRQKRRQVSLCITRFLNRKGKQVECTPLDEQLMLPFTFISMPNKPVLTEHYLVAIRKGQQLRSTD